MRYEGANNHVSGAYDANGDFFPLDSLDQTYSRDGSGNILSIVATNGHDKWTKTFSYTGGKVTNITQWKRS